MIPAYQVEVALGWHNDHQTSRSCCKQAKKEGQVEKKSLPLIVVKEVKCVDWPGCSEEMKTSYSDLLTVMGTGDICHL